MLGKSDKEHFFHFDKTTAYGVADINPIQHMVNFLAEKLTSWIFGLQITIGHSFWDFFQSLQDVGVVGRKFSIEIKEDPDEQVN
jgi:hypothetical protein